MFSSQSTISTSEPMLTSVRLQTSSYGRPCGIVWGRTRVTGNVIWYGNFIATPHTSVTESGGSGGKGGDVSVRQESTSYTYSTGLIVGLGEGPITSINQISTTKTKATLGELGFTAFLGTYSQDEWGFMASSYPTQALKYRGEAYVAASTFQLGNQTGIDNLSFDVTGHLPYNVGVIDDANMADVVLDFLINSYYGVGWSGSLVGDLTTYSNYCRAFGLFLSPALQDQRPAAEILQEWADITNTQLVSSEGKLKFVPYGDKAATANGATYTPQVNAIPLTDGEFLSQGKNKPPISVTRTSSANSFNHIRIEFLDRANDYNPDIEEAKDQADIDIYGLRSDQVYKYHAITTRTVARTIAQLMLQRKLYVRNTYQFRLGWRYVYLEPGDLLTVTDSTQGIIGWPVKIVEVEEDEEGALTITAEDYPGEVSSAAAVATGTVGGYVPNFNISPGSVDLYLPKEPPLILTGGSPQIWLAVSGSNENYGGCEVWVADASESSYRYVATVQGRSRIGTLTANFPTGSDPDTTNVLSVNLSASLGTLTSSSSADADLFRTLCYSGDELIAYSAATLTSPNRYNLGTYIRRGIYGTSKGASNGAKFACMDQAVARFSYKVDEIGRVIKVKFLAFNQYGLAKQVLSDVTAISYTITGAAVQVVTGLVFAQPFIDSFASIKWDKNIHAVSYTVEVRRTAGDVLLRTVDTADTQYTYSWENNRADGGPFRDLTFRVRANTSTNIGLVWATVSGSNPAPAAPTGITLYPGAGLMNIAYTPNTQPDYIGIAICGSTSSGFTPNLGTNLLYRGADTVATVPALVNGQPYYFRLASEDVFGVGTFSSEYSSTPISFEQTPQELVAAINSVLGNSSDSDKLVFQTGAFAIQDPNDSAHYPFAVVDLSVIPIYNPQVLNGLTGMTRYTSPAPGGFFFPYIEIAAEPMAPGQDAWALAQLDGPSGAMTFADLLFMQSASNDAGNYLGEPATLQAPWAPTQVTTSNDYATVEGGAYMADAILESTSGSVVHWLQQEVTKPLGAAADVFIFSVRFKALGANRAIGIALLNTALTASASFRLDLTTGAIIGAAAVSGAFVLHGASVTALPWAGEYLAVLKITTDSSATLVARFTLWTVSPASNTYVGSANSGALIWRPYLQRASQFPGPYPMFPAEPGSSYEFSVYTGAQRCSIDARITFYNSAQAQLGNAFVSTSNNNEKPGGKNLASDYKFLTVTGTAPAGTVYMLALVRRGPTLSGTNSFAYVTGPALRKSPSNWAAMLRADVVIDGNLSVANLTSGNLPSDVYMALGGGTIVLDGAGAITVYDGLGANKNFVLLNSGDIVFKKYIAGLGYVQYKSLRRMESGVASSGQAVTIPGYWEQQPTIMVSPAVLGLYDASRSGQNQAVRCQALNLRETASGSMRWMFDARATLEYGSATGQTQINYGTGDTNSNVYLVPTGGGVWTTPANTTQITVTTKAKSTRGNGASQFFYRAYYFTLDYKANGSGTWIVGAAGTNWVNFGAQFDYVTAQLVLNFPSAGTWDFRVNFVWSDSAGGVFGGVTYQYSTETLIGTNLGLICRSDAVYPATDVDNGVKGGLPASTINTSWEIYRIDYLYQYDITLVSNSTNASGFWYGNMGAGLYCRGTAKDSLSYVNLTSQTIPQRVNTQGSHTITGSFLTHDLNPISASTNANAGTDTFGAATALANLDSLSATIYRQTPVVNSTTPVNNAVVLYYDFNLASASVIAAGSLNWIAVGV